MAKTHTVEQGEREAPSECRSGGDHVMRLRRKTIQAREDGSGVVALPIAPKLARLKKRAQAAGMSTIYVNDNFGQWRSDVSKLLGADDAAIRGEPPHNQR